MMLMTGTTLTNRHQNQPSPQMEDSWPFARVLNRCPKGHGSSWAVRLTALVIAFQVCQIGLAPDSWASLPPKSKSSPDKRSLNSWVHQAGALRGGKAGSGFSLLDLERQPLAKGRGERLQIEMGDLALEPLKGSVGYYHAELRSEPPKLVINLNQTLTSRIENQELLRRLKGSPLIRKSELFFDPVGQSMSLQLELKSKASVRAMSVPGKGKQSARLIFDLLPYQEKASKANSRKSLK